MQSYAEQNQRPPIVTFEQREVEDRDESRRAGYKKYKTVDYAIVTPSGSRDRLENLVEDWLPRLQQNTDAGRWPQSWMQQIEEKYKAWKQGLDLPEDGTPIRMWPAASPTEVRQILGANIRTVEDLAMCNEEGIKLMGMGGRMLKQRAEQYLKTASNIGRVAEENNHLKQQVTDLQERLEAMQKVVDKLTPPEA